MERNVRGISFPFRISNRGGVTMSEASIQDVSHIEESIQQILCTRIGERVMNPEFGSELDLDLFTPQDASLNSLIRYQVLEALTKYEPRITVKEDNIVIFAIKSEIQIEIKYTLKNFPNVGLLRTLINLGGVDFEK